jgi:hypothetical protein
MKPALILFDGFLAATRDDMRPVEHTGGRRERS